MRASAASSRLAGFVLTENRAMLGFAVKLGFSLVRDADATLTRAVWRLPIPCTASRRR